MLSTGNVSPRKSTLQKITERLFNTYTYDRGIKSSLVIVPTNRITLTTGGAAVKCLIQGAFGRKGKK